MQTYHFTFPDPKSVSLDPLNELAQESTEVIVLVLVLLKELLGSQNRRFPLEKRADLIRLVERIENSHLPQRKAMNFLMSPPSSQDSSFFEATPPAGLDPLGRDFNDLLSDFEVLRQMQRGTVR